LSWETETDTSFFAYFFVLRSEHCAHLGCLLNYNRNYILIVSFIQKRSNSLFHLQGNAPLPTSGILFFNCSIPSLIFSLANLRNFYLFILPDLYSAFFSCKYTFKSAVHRTLENEFTHKIHTQYVNTNHILL